MDNNFSDLNQYFLEKTKDFKDSTIIWTFSVPEQRYLYISPNFENFFGYELNKIYLNPKLWLDLIQEESYKQYTRKIWKDTFLFESNYSFKNINEEKFEVEETILPIFDEHNQLIQLQGLTIIKKERDQNPIKENKDIPFPFFRLENHNGDWILSEVSKSFLSILSEINNSKSEYLTYTNPLIKLIIEKIKDSYKDKVIKFEYESLQNDFEKYYLVEITLNDDTEIKQAIGHISDVTKYKIIEKRLQKINSDKNKFLSIISHDLKAPFNTILNFINLLNDGIEIDENQKKEYFQFIYEIAKQQLELVHELLDWSKIEAGFLEFSPKFIDLDLIINKIISGFSGQIYQKDIQIVKDFGKGTKVFFDKNYLKIVLSNIISNAIKFSHKKGKILISVRDEEHYTDIIIQDFGIGFPVKYLKNLMDSNEISLQIGTIGEKGTGLGLKFCHELITSNKGKLTIESRSQKGTKVTIRLKKPAITLVYIGEENEINQLKNFSIKIQPEIFLYLCTDIIDFYRFVSENKIDLAFVNLDSIQTFQQSCIEKIFSELSSSSRIIGFTSYLDSVQELKKIIKLDVIESFSHFEEKIKDQIKLLS